MVERFGWLGSYLRKGIDPGLGLKQVILILAGEIIIVINSDLEELTMRKDIGKVYWLLALSTVYCFVVVCYLNLNCWWKSCKRNGNVQRTWELKEVREKKERKKKSAALEERSFQNTEGRPGGGSRNDLPAIWWGLESGSGGEEEDELGWIERRRKKGNMRAEASSMGMENADWGCWHHLL